MANIIKLIVSIALPLAAAGIGSYFTTPQIPGWYQGLEKPFFSPPNYLFGPVWTILYTLMGIAFYLIWKNNDQKKKINKAKGTEFYFAQLFVNIFWSFAFFGLKSPLFGFIVILLLWFLIYKTIKTFYKVDKTASYLLYPYIAWVSFATILNLAIFILNR